MSVNVILNPSNTPKEKAQISWNGGNSVANDKLKITQSKKMKNEGSFTISASVSADSGSTGSSSSGSTQSQTKETKKVVKLYVFDKEVKCVITVPCANNTATRAAGSFKAGFEIHEGNEKTYYNGNSLFFSYDSIIVGGSWYKIGEPGKINLTPDDSAKVNPIPANIEQAINDMTPDKYGIVSPAEYWSSYVVAQHELYHATDWETHCQGEFNEIIPQSLPCAIELLKDLSFYKKNAYDRIKGELVIALIRAEGKFFKKENICDIDPCPHNNRGDECRAYQNTIQYYNEIISIIGGKR